MSNAEHNTQLPYQLSQDLLALYDEFVEFHDTCAFFCDAMSTMLSSREEFSQATLDGVTDFSNYLKQSGGELKGRFRAVQESTRTLRLGGRAE